MGASWEGGQGLGLQPLKAHYSFSPQPAALQHRPAGRSARGRGAAGLARQTLSKEECELSGHLGPIHLTHPAAPRTPAASSTSTSTPQAQVSADPAYSPHFHPGRRGFLLIADAPSLFSSWYIHSVWPQTFMARATALHNYIESPGVVQGPSPSLIQCSGSPLHPQSPSTAPQDPLFFSSSHCQCATLTGRRAASGCPACC